jgi:DNA-binding transcriptional LysR family regulator
MAFDIHMVAIMPIGTVGLTSIELHTLGAYPRLKGSSKDSQLSGRSIISDGFCGTSCQCLSCFLDFFGCDGLFEDDAQASFIVAREKGWGRLAAEITVDARAVHVKCPGDIAGVFLISICHRFSCGPSSSRRRTEIFACRQGCEKFIASITVMRVVNEFLATGPFDLYELKLFHLVAENRNFTRAGQAAGLTQSAITRQIQGMEEKLGLKLFDRSTRQVRLTPEGAALYARSGAILAEVDSALLALRGKSALLPRTLRVGISRTVGLAYLPGFFHAFQRKSSNVQIHVSHESSAYILGAIESGELDAGVVSPPPRLPRSLEMAHQFTDEFIVILPPKAVVKASQPIKATDLGRLFKTSRWLLISRQSNTGKRLHGWLEKAGFRCEPTIEADNPASYSGRHRASI